MYNLKQGTLKFVLNSSIDTNPTMANLKLWGKSTSDLCPLCKKRQTTAHILSSCNVSLKSDRYLWHHNCIVDYIVTTVSSNYRVHSDLAGYTVSGGGSIPPEMCITSLKPDIVIIN